MISVSRVEDPLGVLDVLSELGSRGHGDWVAAVAFSPDGRWLALGRPRRHGADLGDRAGSGMACHES
jgi:hypothetical protein